jgi:hypothetical protein
LTGGAKHQPISSHADKIGISGPFTDNLVDAMAAVGVLKLEPSRPARETSCHCRWPHGAQLQ